MKDLEKRPFSNTLQGSRVELEIISPQYGQKVFEYIQRDHVLGGNLYHWVESLDDVYKDIAVAPKADFKSIHYVILKDDQAIGSIHVHTISYCDYKAEVGFGIEKGKEGMGYVSEALQLVLAEMARLGFNKAVISCDNENIRSKGVAERNGFRCEGLLIEDCIENGHFRNSAVYGKILRPRNL